MASGGVKVTLDSFRPSSAFALALLRGPVAERLVRARGELVRARAASMYGATGYGLRVKVGARRVRALVHTSDLHAMRSNMLHQTLRKAVRG